MLRHDGGWITTIEFPQPGNPSWDRTHPACRKSSATLSFSSTRRAPLAGLPRCLCNCSVQPRLRKPNSINTDPPSSGIAKSQCLRLPTAAGLGSRNLNVYQCQRTEAVGKSPKLNHYQCHPSHPRSPENSAFITVLDSRLGDSRKSQCLSMSSVPFQGSEKTQLLSLFCSH